MKRLRFKEVPHPSTVINGIGKTGQLATRWVRVPLTINGIIVETFFAAVQYSPCPILLGMPFLLEVDAIHHIPRAVLKGTFGTVQLEVRRQPPVVVALVVDDEEVWSPTISRGEEPHEELWDERVPQSPLSAASRHSQVSLFNDQAAWRLLPDQLRLTLGRDMWKILGPFSYLWDENRQTFATGVEHHIVLNHRRPIVLARRNFTERENEIIREEVTDMLSKGVIRQSYSEYEAQPVLVQKKPLPGEEGKEAKHRFCVDFRRVNDATRKDRYPLPRIDMLLRLVKGSKYFCALDLKSGYWQIKMAEDSIPYTAFSCIQGFYEFTVMPFGLVNAPATFQRLMDNIFKDLRDKGVLCYLDDILIHHEDYNECLKLLTIVLQRLSDHGLTVNIKKSVFFPESIKYLGQILSKGEVRPDTSKVEALGRITKPETVSDVRSILGFLGYYNHYIPRYAEIMKPIHGLLRGHVNTKANNKKTKVDWTPICQKALDTAVSILQTAVLHLAVDGDEFVLETDASAHTVAGVLSVRKENGEGKEELQPVEFVSKTLNDTQTRWSTTEREAYAIIYALLKFDPVIRGRNIRVYTDHKSLEWLKKSEKGKISRWAAILSEYNLDIYYKKGKDLAHIDFLTRQLTADGEGVLDERMCFMACMAPQMWGSRIVDLPSLEDIRVAQQELGVVASGRGYYTHEGITYYHGRVFVPQSMRVKVIQACHTGPPLMHPGAKRTTTLVRRCFNWPGCKQDVSKYLTSCLPCQRARSGDTRVKGLLRSHKATRLMETLYIDFWQVTYRKHLFTLLTVIDCCSKWAECLILPNREAETVIRLLRHEWFERYGVPRVIVSDRDGSFMNELVLRLAQQVGFIKLEATAYHPEGNGLIESFHKTINQMFRFLNQGSLSFRDALSLVLWAYRATPHTTTLQSPAYLLYGQEMRPPQMGDWRFYEEAPEEERIAFIQALRVEIQYKVHQVAERRREKKNEKRVAAEFRLGEVILVRETPLAALDNMPSYYKAVPRWSTPYRVVRVFSPPVTAVALNLLTGKHRMVHVQDAKEILPPVDQQQQAEWEEAFRATPVESVFDDDKLKEVIAKYFVPVEEVLTELEEQGIEIPWIYRRRLPGDQTMEQFVEQNPQAWKTITEKVKKNKRGVGGCRRSRGKEDEDRAFVDAAEFVTNMENKMGTDAQTETTDGGKFSGTFRERFPRKVVKRSVVPKPEKGLGEKRVIKRNPTHQRAKYDLKGSPQRQGCSKTATEEKGTAKTPGRISNSITERADEGKTMKSLGGGVTHAIDQGLSPVDTHQIGAEWRRRDLVEGQRFDTELAKLYAEDQLRYPRQRPSEDFRPEGVFTRRRATVNNDGGGVNLTIPKDVAIEVHQGHQRHKGVSAIAETDTVQIGKIDCDIVIPLEESPTVVQRIAPDLPNEIAQRRVYKWKDKDKIGLLSFKPFNAPIHCNEELRSSAAARLKCCVTDHRYEHIRKRDREEEELNRSDKNRVESTEEEEADTTTMMQLGGTERLRKRRATEMEVQRPRAQWAEEFYGNRASFIGNDPIWWLNRTQDSPGGSAAWRLANVVKKYEEWEAHRPRDDGVLFSFSETLQPPTPWYAKSKVIEETEPMAVAMKMERERQIAQQREDWFQKNVAYSPRCWPGSFTCPPREVYEVDYPDAVVDRGVGKETPKEVATRTMEEHQTRATQVENSESKVDEAVVGIGAEESESETGVNESIVMPVIVESESEDRPLYVQDASRVVEMLSPKALSNRYYAWR